MPTVEYSVMQYGVEGLYVDTVSTRWMDWPANADLSIYLVPLHASTIPYDVYYGHVAS